MVKRIVVTQDDINNGKRKSYCECPVALAVKRAFRTNRSGKPVHVRHEAIMVGELTGDRFYVALTDSATDKFISNFDQGVPVKPFEALIEFR